MEKEASLFSKLEILMQKLALALKIEIYQIIYGLNLNVNDIILRLAPAAMTKRKLKYQDRIASQVLAGFRYGMLSVLIFAQYSI